MLKKIALFAILTLIFAPFELRAEDNTITLNGKNDPMAGALYWALSEETPPFESWAEEESEYRRATEFDRDEVKEKIIAEYKGQINDLKDIDSITINTSNSLGSYDSTKGGFPIRGPDNSRYFVYGSTSIRAPMNKYVKLTIENYGEFDFYKIDKDKAKELLESTGNDRSFDTKLYLKIKRAGKGRRSFYNDSVIETRLEKMELSHNGRLIHTLETKTDATVFDVAKKDFDKNNVDIAGFKLGMTVDDVKKTISDNAYKNVPMSKYGSQDEEIDLYKPGGLYDGVLVTPNAEDNNCTGFSPLGEFREGFDCIVLTFNPGEKKMFGSKQATLKKIERYRGMSRAAMNDNVATLMKAHGKEHFLDGGQIESYGWGEGDGDEVKSYGYNVRYREIRSLMGNPHADIAETRTLQ